MGSPNTSKYVRGFSFIEILVVMGIFVILGTLSLFVSMDTYHGSNFRSDRDLVVTLLQHARAQAMHNICTGTCTDGKPHGVYIGSGTYTVFQGSSYATRDVAEDQTYTANSTLVATGDSEVVFANVTGVVSASRTITLTAEQNSTITVDPSGRISWTN